MPSEFEKRPFIEFSEKTIRIRRNLLAVSLLSFIIARSGVKINSASFFGLGIDNFSMSDLHLILTVVIFYFLLEFCWNAWDEVLKWRLKLTNPVITGQDNLYITVASVDEDKANRTVYNELFFEEHKSEISKAELNDLKQKVDHFIEWFFMYEKSQVRRFRIIETGLPVAFALISIFLLNLDSLLKILCNFSCKVQ